MSGCRGRLCSPRARSLLVPAISLTITLHCARPSTEPEANENEGVRWPPAMLLAPGTGIEREIRTGETQRFHLEVPAAQYLRLTADSRHVDLELILTGPDDQQVAAMHLSAGRWRPESLSALAGEAGTWKLLLRGRAPPDSQGEYSLRFEEIRPATDADRSRVEAQRALTKGIELFEGGTKDEYVEALTQMRQAFHLWRQVGDESPQAVALYWIGVVQIEMPSFAEASDHLEQAARAQRQLGDLAREADATYQLGIIEHAQGRYETSLEWLEKALAVYEELDEREPAAFAHMHIGYVFKRQTKLQAALDHYFQARAILRDLGNRKWHANALNNIGSTLQVMGELDQARDYFEEALPISRTLGDLRRQAALLNNIGWGLKAQGKAGESVPYFQEALRIAREQGNDRWKAIYLDNIGRAYLGLGQPQETLEYSGQALEIGRDLGDRRGQAVRLNSLGIAYQELRESGLAATCFEEALEISRQIENRKNEAVALYGLAGLHRSAGDLEAAREHIEKALAVVEDIRTDIGSLLLKATYLGSRHSFYELLIDLLVEQARGLPETGQQSLGDAVAAFERARARSLLESLAGVGAKTPELNQPLSLDEIQRQVLDNDTLLLDYALGDERSHLFAVTKEGVEAFELPGRGEIEKAASQVYEHITRAPDGSETDPMYRRASSRLSEILLGPVADRLAGQRLVLVAEGAIQSIPFSAMPYPGSSGERLLIFEHEITSLPSASVLALSRRRVSGRLPAPRTLAVLADPVFEPYDRRFEEPPSVDNDGPAFQRLRNSGREAEAIAQLVAEEERFVALGFQASRRAALSPKMARFRYLHFATHGVLNDRKPELSGLVLSLYDEKGVPRDGFLRLHDIYTLELNADLAVLSACQTALGRAIRGEGLVGLTWGFMNAGAERVVASLWQVDDRATSELMQRFYQGLLLRNLRPAAALRAAQIEMARGDAGHKTWSHPYYWAAFVLQGEWR